MDALKQFRYKYWGYALAFSILLLAIDNKYAINEERTTIYVKAPDTMYSVFELTLSGTRLNKDYKLEVIEDEEKANFIVTNEINENANLLAYSPIIAVFNSDEKLYESFIEQEIFVQSEVDSDEYDFDFKKVIDTILDENSSSPLKIYYPGENTELWDEFYNFLLFTINDGYYPKNDIDLEKTNKKVEAFLNSKNTEKINKNALERSNGFSQNSIYFMTYADLGNFHKTSGVQNCRIMYPKTVVYQSFYSKYDEVGKVLYEALDKSDKGLFPISSHIGYYYLRSNFYNTKYNKYVPNIGDYVKGERDEYNGVEIPVT